MKKTYFYILISLFFLAFLSCDDKEESLLGLNRSSVTMEIDGRMETIKLKANGEWQITGIPEWLTVSPESGSNSAEIAIMATENEGLSSREATLVFTSGTTNKTLEIKQLGLSDLEPYLELSKPDISMNVSGESEVIELNANRAWEVTNIPAWVTVEPASGNGSAEITISVNENVDADSRQVNLEFALKEGDLTKKLTVIQYGRNDYIRVPGLPIFSFSRIAMTGNGDYTMETNRPFINPGIKDKVYIGNLISQNAGDITNIPEFTGYTFNPITISTSANTSGEITKTYLPSLAVQNAFVRQIVEGNPSPVGSITEDKGLTEFYTYRQLHAEGIANLGIKLDELVSGTPYTEKEMSKKYGMIYSFKQILLELDMDIPDKLIKENLRDADKAKGVSYVCQVRYGKVGLLVIESDINSRSIRTAVDKVLKGEPITSEESSLIEAADISYVYFDNDNAVQLKKGKLDAINAYKASKADKTVNVYPVEFVLSDFANHSVNTTTYSFSAPKNR